MQNMTEKPSKSLVKREYTDEEKKRIAKYFKRCKRQPMKVKGARGVSSKPLEVRVTSTTTDATLGTAMLMEAFGTPDSGLQWFLLNQVAPTFRGLASSKGADHKGATEVINNAIALLSGIQPRDEIEGMLAVQMIAVHNMIMETMRLAMSTDQTFEGREANINYATKMLRTFTAQTEALQRHRTGGQQKVVVEHVEVKKGGQAIVGAVSTGGGYEDQKRQ